MFGFPARPKADNFRFTHNLLRSATFQVKYIGGEKTDAVTGDIIAALISFFPIAKKIEKQSLKFEVTQESKTPLISSEGSPGGIQFETSDAKKVMVINDDSITITYSGDVYSNFAEAQAEFYAAIEPVLAIIKVESFNRVGVRKINGLHCDLDSSVGDANWLAAVRDAFNPVLTAHVAGLPSATSLVSTVVNNRFKINNDTLNLVYGLLPKEVEPGVRQLILDIDLWGLEEYKTLEQVKTKFQDINNEVFNVFMWCMSEELLSVITG